MSLFLRCQEPGCNEFAISFSANCWDHTSQTEYLAGLQAHLNSFKGNALCANFKKVECEEIDFSHLNLAGSSLSQLRAHHCFFIGTNLNGSNLAGAKFRNCDLVGADMIDVNLIRGHFTSCSLSHADLQNANLTEVIFRETDLMGAILFNCIFLSADLSGANYLKKDNFLDPRPAGGEPKVHLSEKEPLLACESYRSIKHYFHRRGLYEDASWAAYKELTMERKHLFNIRSPRYLPSLLMDLLSGYTERPHRVIVSSLGLVFFFGILYYFLGAIRSTLDTGIHPSVWDNIYFSFVSFTTVGYGDFVPKPVLWAKALVCLESFSGPFMAGLYIFTLTRRYSAN